MVTTLLSTPTTHDEKNLSTVDTQRQETMDDCKLSDYELSREERIRENRERMQKLGIVDISLKLKALKPTRTIPISKTTLSQRQMHSPSPPSGPVRRSSRLQNSTPVSYCEVPVAKKEKSLREDDLLREVGSRPEVYTEEHEKLLGSTEMSWTLFVDGYGKDGKRIYDPVRGKTCHQCRQKTLGHRTHCSKCNMVQGQFCGDCLYMRYGENVLEANANPDWICPVCRGICNCSLCRQAKGWAPTGALYRKISSLGYKSVAHYLILTRRSNTDSDKSGDTKVSLSAKRSLPFSDTEVTPAKDEPSKSIGESTNTGPVNDVDEANGHSEIAHEFLTEAFSFARELKNEVEYQQKPQTETELSGSEGDGETEAIFLVDTQIDKITVELKFDAEHNVIVENKDCSVAHETSPLSSKQQPLLERMLEKDDANENEKEDNIVVSNKDFLGHETSPTPAKKRVRPEPTPDSIGGRLKLRRNKNNGSEELVSVIDNCAAPNAAKATKAADVDSIARRLKMRCRA